jgi:hypothetical protein
MKSDYQQGKFRIWCEKHIGEQVYVSTLNGTWNGELFAFGWKQTKTKKYKNWFITLMYDQDDMDNHDIFNVTEIIDGVKTKDTEGNLL